MADIGHNRQLFTDPDALTEYLRESYPELITRHGDLMAAEPPDTIESEDSAGKMGDFIKQISACIKALNTSRTGEKEPYLEGGRRVDGFFNKMKTGLDALKTSCSKTLTDYQVKKESEERRRREAEERAAREAEEKARAEAAEAERRAAEAEAAGKAAEADSQLDNAVTMTEVAEQKQAEASQAEKAAAANAAELSRSRGDYGSVASLRTVWDFRGLDRDSLDLETLRQHLPLDGLEKALRSFIKSGGRDITGAEIYERRTTSVR